MFDGRVRRFRRTYDFVELLAISSPHSQIAPFKNVFAPQTAPGETRPRLRAGRASVQFDFAAGSVMRDRYEQSWLPR